MIFRVGEQLDKLTLSMQEGRLTSGKELVRPYRGRPMFVGVVLTGFGGDWITTCARYVCASPIDTARCLTCQCGICEEDGILIGIAGIEEQHGTNAWQGALLACCRHAKAYENRQGRILDFWKLKSSERLD